MTHACGLTPDGEAYCWFNNPPNDAPTPVPTDLRFVQISLGWGLNSSYTCGRTGAGEVYCWGRNDWGELGDGGTVEYSPTPVRGFTGITAVDVSAGGGRTCVLDEEGQAYCVGRNCYGQLGRGHVSAHELSVEPIALDATLRTVEGGIFGACALADDGRAYCWGLPDLASVRVEAIVGPSEVTGGLRFTQLSAGIRTHACGIAQDGLLYCWGRNQYGQLGDGTVSEDSFAMFPPVRVAGQL